MQTNPQHNNENAERFHRLKFWIFALSIVSRLNTDNFNVGHFIKYARNTIQNRGVIRCLNGLNSMPKLPDGVQLTCNRHAIFQSVIAILGLLLLSNEARKWLLGFYVWRSYMQSAYSRSKVMICLCFIVVNLLL